MVETVGFPVFSVLVWRRVDGGYGVAVGGGGGASRSGVPNAILLYQYTSSSSSSSSSSTVHTPYKLDKLDTLDTIDDAVMAMALLTPDTIIAGVGMSGWNVLVHRTDTTKLLLMSSTRCDHGGADDPHVRLVAAGAGLAATVACDGTVRVWSVGDSGNNGGGGWREEAVLVVPGADPEAVSDVSFSSSLFVIVSHREVLKYTRMDQSGQFIKEPVSTINTAGGTLSIRAIRSFQDGFVVVLLDRKRKTSQLHLYSSNLVDTLPFTISLPHLVTSISATNQLIALGTNDGSVIVLDDSLHTILHVCRHSFSVTSVSIVDNVVVSGSADGTFDVLEVSVVERQIDSVVIFLSSLLALLLAHLLSQRDFL
jgi:hypothetical protein